MIERRVLLNYRLEPELARNLLPEGLRPQIVRGSAVAGTCFIRLAQVRPTGTPPALGWRIDNAAHRIAVEWDGPAAVERGVFLPEQFSGSRAAFLARKTLAGRLLPTPDTYATFDNRETEDKFMLAIRSAEQFARVDAVRSHNWCSRLFETHQASSEFFKASSIGWSITAQGLRGVRLQSARWSTSPLRVRDLESTFFNALPAGAAAFDHALLMQRIPAVWQPVRFPRSRLTVRAAS